MTAYIRAKAVGSVTVTNSPSSVPAGTWLTPTNAYASNNTYASTSTDDATQQYGNYGISIPSGAVITKVEVGFEAYTEGNEKIGITCSWDGGTTWATEKVSTPLGTSDPNTVTWVDFTGATSWTVDKLSNANFQTRAKGVKIGEMSTVYLDWIPVRVTYRTHSAVIVWRTYNTDYESSAFSIAATFTDYSQTRTTNPNTGQAWTWGEVNALEIGSRASTLGSTETIQVSEFWIVVNYTPTPPEITIVTTSLPDGTVGVAYSQTLAATGGTTPYTWSLFSGSLPGGLSLSTGGVISGTPTAEGDFNFTVKVTDANLQEDTRALSIHVGVISLFNFSVSASPDNLTLRQGESATSTITVSLVSGAAETVSLRGAWVGIAPTGISTVFSTQSGTPPFSSTLTFTASSTASGGTFIYEVRGSGGGLTRTDTITLMLPPAAPSLVSPADGTAIETNTPTFDWNDVVGAVSYTLQVATDNNFSYMVFSTDSVNSIVTSPSTLSYGTRYYWKVQAKNSVGASDWSAVWSFTAKLDAPRVTSFQIAAGAQYTNFTSIELTISARNAFEMSFSSDGVIWGEWKPYQTSKSYTLEAPDGSKSIYIRVKDNVGDISQMTLDSIILDRTPPSTTHSLSGDLGADGYKGSVVVTLASMDAYAVESTRYRIDNDEWRTGRTFVVSTDGKHTIEYYSTDAAGNEEEIKSFQATVYTPTMFPPILTQYWWAFLGTIMAVGVTSFYVARKAKVAGRLKRIKMEKAELLKLKKDAETKYFKEGSISRETFDSLIKKYADRAAEVEKEERVLRAKVGRKAKRERKRK